MVAICLDFKWLGFLISDPIWNPDHLQLNLFLTIQNPNQSGFQIPTVINSFLNGWMASKWQIVQFFNGQPSHMTRLSWTILYKTHFYVIVSSIHRILLYSK